MTQPLMPKATAVWLIENTALSFEQIADFCGLHMLEVQSIADDEVAIGMVGFDPIANGQLTKEEIQRCTADSNARLDMAKPSVEIPQPKKKGPRYTPVARRQDRPDAIAWMLRNYPELSDGQISRLVGTTKPTINSVRERSHWNISNIKPRDPVSLGLCSREDLGAAIDKARRAVERAEKRAEREKARQDKAAAETAADTGAAEEATEGDTSQPEPATDTATMEADPQSASPPAPAEASTAPADPFSAPEPAAAPEPVTQDPFSAPEPVTQDPAPAEDTPSDDPAGYPRPE